MATMLSFRERQQLPRVVERRPNGEIVVQYARMGRVEINADACTGCRLCVRVCPGNALEMDGPKNVRMLGEYAGCIACGDCVAICRTDAIRLTQPLVYAGRYKTLGRGALCGARRF